MNSLKCFLVITTSLSPITILTRSGTTIFHKATGRFAWLTSSEPNDPGFTNQWAYDSAELPEAWDISIGSRSVSVAVIDTGVETPHSDLSANYDLYGLSSSFDSYLNINSSVDINNPNGHGTQVAGIIGATGNNNLGISGVCWKVDIVSMTYFDNNGNQSFQNLATAFNYATACNIPVINLSSGFGPNTLQFFVEQAIRSYPGLIVCSAGNNGHNIDNIGNEIFPASYFNLNNLIVVGAITENGNLRSNSNYGPTSVDLFAPGDNVLTTDKSTTGYGVFGATSCAAPFVAGTAALLKAINPDLTTAQLKAAILDNVTQTSTLSGKCVTGGKLNAYQAALSVIPTLGNTSYRFVDKDGYNWEKIVISSPSTYSFTLMGNPGLSLTIASDPASELVPLETATISPGQTSISKSLLFTHPGNYYVKVNNATVNDTYYTLNKTFVSYHSHSFTGPNVYLDNEYHGRACECGEYGNLMHHITKSNNPHLCIQCGGYVY